MGRGLKITLIIAAIQLTVTLLVWLASQLLYTNQVAGSVLIGGAIGVITTLFFGLRVFAGGSFLPAGKMLKALYMGEIQKVVLTIILIVIATKWLKVLFFPMMAAYAITLMVFWLVLPFRAISERK